MTKRTAVVQNVLDGDVGILSHSERQVTPHHVPRDYTLITHNRTTTFVQEEGFKPSIIGKVEQYVPGRFRCVLYTKPPKTLEAALKLPPTEGTLLEHRYTRRSLAVFALKTQHEARA